VIDHFYHKLFKLADKMNTPSARQEALRRAAFMRCAVFMRHYLAELAREMGTVAE
jgi:HD superfamily phosphodiesterase